MKAIVHYMIRKPDAAGEVIYPSDLDSGEGYYGYGMFLLAGTHDNDVQRRYSFLAIRKGRVVDIKLEQRTTNIFQANVPDVGEFEFVARKISPPARYNGASPDFSGGYLIRTLASRDPEALDQAVHEHDFYFVGYTPKLVVSG